MTLTSYDLTFQTHRPWNVRPKMNHLTEGNLHIRARWAVYIPYIY